MDWVLVIKEPKSIDSITLGICYIFHSLVSDTFLAEIGLFTFHSVDGREHGWTELQGENVT